MISWKSKRKRKTRNSRIGRSWRSQRRTRKKVVRKETTRSPSPTRTLDADTKVVEGISNKAKVVEGIKEKDTRTKTKVVVTKEEDSKAVAEATIRVAVSEEEAEAMVEISIISRAVEVIVALLQPIRLVSLIGTTIIIIISWTIRVMIRDHFTPIRDGIDN